MAPLSNVPGSHLREMAFVTVTPDVTDVFLSAEVLTNISSERLPMAFVVTRHLADK